MADDQSAPSAVGDSTDAGQSAPSAAEDATDEGQSASPTVEDARKAKQNPLSALRSLYFQNILGRAGNGVVNNFSIQPVWPVRLPDDWRLITYTIAPIESLPSQDPRDSRVSGLN